MAGAGITPENAPRMITLLSASLLVTELTSGAEPLAVVQALATSDLRTSEAGVGRSISAAPTLATFLSSFEWDVLAAATALSDHRRVRRRSRLVASSPRRWRQTSTSCPWSPGYRKPKGTPIACWRRRKVAAALVLALVQAPAVVASLELLAPQPEQRLAVPAPASKTWEPVRALRCWSRRDWDVLPPENAKAELDRLKSRLETEPGARLMISWRLTRDGGKG